MGISFRFTSWLPNAFVLALFCLFNSMASGADSKPLNVILILADDLGWTDLACFGSDLYETPNLDAMAKRGMRFTQNYSACTVCSPTRAALLTGKYPARLHVTDWIPGMMPDNPKLLVPDWTKYLPLEEVTLAELFRDAGYKTAMIGKWHLGTEEYYPEKHGFDLNIGGTDKAAPPTYFAPWNIPTLSEGKEGEYLTDRLGREAADFIQKNRDQPFFLYLPHFAVHTPIQGKEPLIQKYRQKMTKNHRHRNARYAALVESMDSAIGEVFEAVKNAGIQERTLIIFTSDNGGRITNGTTSNHPLRYGKASAYEGGVRVPMIVEWPGVVPADTVCNSLTVTMDIFPTLREILLDSQSLSNKSAPVAQVDGTSLLPLLREPTHKLERNLYWHYPHHQHYQLGGAMPYGAIRSGDYKLIEFYNDNRVELYNILSDIGEERDLANAEPKLVADLLQQLHAWRKEVGAQMPTPNPTYDPSKAEYNPPNVERN